MKSSYEERIQQLERRLQQNDNPKKQKQQAEKNQHPEKYKQKRATNQNQTIDLKPHVGPHGNALDRFKLDNSQNIPSSNYPPPGRKFNQRQNFSAISMEEEQTVTTKKKMKVINNLPNYLDEL